MHNFQNFIKNVRESKNLELKTISDAINLSEETLHNIENANNNDLLQSSGSLFKNQIRRYCEYLEIPEKKIVSILNKIDVLYYKKSRYGKLKTFDYINRAIILIIALATIILVSKQVRDSINTASINSTENSKSSIIYTPINYGIEKPKTNEETTAKEADNNDSEQPHTSMPEEKKLNEKELVAHPPTTANMDNIVIDPPSPD